MRMFFEYNWQVREDWFRWCESHLDELDKPRTGGLGSIRKTLFHVVNVEQSWIRELAGLPEIRYQESSFPTLQHIRELSQRHRGEIIQFLESWTPDMEHKILRGFKPNGEPFEHTYGEVIRHVITHEIHHMGQLSVWAREIGDAPVTANLIGRNLAART
jgi:uncharacterized damage-inducible protein DinB